MPTPSRLLSIYGITAMNVSQTVGTITPARPLSMWRRSSCRLRRYHGAFDGFGVQSGVAWSWSGALNAAAMTQSPIDQSIAAMNSITRRCGQTIAVSSTRLSTRTTESCRTNASSRSRFSCPAKGCGPRGVVMLAGPARSRGPGMVSLLAAGYARPPMNRPRRARARWAQTLVARQHAVPSRLETCGLRARDSQRSGDAAILSDAPEVDGDQETGGERERDDVQHIETQKCVRSELESAKHHEAELVADERRRAGDLVADGHRPERELVPRKQVSGVRDQDREEEEERADDPVELSRRLVRPGVEDADHVQEDRDDHAVRGLAVQ